MQNDKTAQRSHRTILIDELYDPFNKLESTRSWDLGTFEPGDQVTLTYSVAFDAYKTKPGTYRNIARITGQRNDETDVKKAKRIPLIEASGNVTFATDAAGQVLGAATASCPLLSTNIGFGLANNPSEVIKLQQFLNKDPATQVAASGPGSPGAETGVFGPLTRNAINAFQRKYASENLNPLGLSAPTGSAHNSTRA